MAQVLEDIPAKTRRTLDWVLRAETALRDGSDEASILCAEYQQLDRVVHWPPWHERLCELYASLSADAELSPLIEEWRSDVLAGLRDPISVLGQMHGGRQLTHAFAHSYAGRLQAAYRTLCDVSVEAPRIINDLRSLLEGLLLLNFGGGAALPEGPSPRCHRRLRPLLVGLRILLARQLCEPSPPATDAADALPPELLPLRPDDVATMKAALETLSFPKSLNSDNLLA
jgi:hypothetical protein